MADVITKTELAKTLGVSVSRVGKMVKAGMPVQADGRVNADEAIHWVAVHVRSWRGGWETDENGRRRRIPIN
jgi:hypothetical protein